MFVKFNNINQLTSITTKDIAQFDLIIDGIFGSGLNRDIKNCPINNKAIL